MSKGCGARLSEGQWFIYCGETDMGQTSPALCMVCGGAFSRADGLTVSRHKPEKLINDRYRFEAWVSADGKMPQVVDRKSGGRYTLAKTQAMWEAWQAAVASERSND